MTSWTQAQAHAIAGITSAAGQGMPATFAPAFGAAEELRVAIQEGNTPLIVDGQIQVSQDHRSVVFAVADLAATPQRGDRLQIDGVWYVLDQAPVRLAESWQCVIRRERG